MRGTSTCRRRDVPRRTCGTGASATSADASRRWRSRRDRATAMRARRGTRGPLLLLGRGVVVHHLARRVALPLGGLEEIAPAAERFVERDERSPFDEGRVLVPTEEPRRTFACEVVGEEIEQARDALARFGT